MTNARTLYPALMRALHDLEPEENVQDALVLARWVMAHKARIAEREASGDDVVLTARALSDVADTSVQEALRRAVMELCPALRDAQGEVCGLVFLGMGKLAGQELNPSSDVDLVAIYDPEAMRLRGASEPASVAIKLVANVIRQLEALTEYGQAWRVDMRLRPEGARGLLAHDIAAACRYFELFGRTWERAAYMRSRAVAGDLSLGNEFAERLAPWIWRRSVDPRVGQDLARMVLQSRLEHAIDVETNLKLGHGGIREVEFFVQGLQLVWGGRHPELRVVHTLDALRALQGGGWVQPDESGLLQEAWRMLRRLEHDTQFATMRQSHDCPPADRLVGLASSMGFASGPELNRHFSQLRRQVHLLFQGFLPGIADSSARAFDGVRRLVHDGNVPALADALARMGYASPESFADALAALGRRPTDPFGRTTAQTHPGFAEDFFDEILESASPSAASQALARMLRMWRDPTWLCSLLVGSAAARKALISTLGTSELLAEMLTARPDAIVDWLRDDFQNHGAERHDDASLDDEAFVARERRCRSQVVLSAASVFARMTQPERLLPELTATLSREAESAVQSAFERAQRFGKGSSWAVFGVGKLAGLELGVLSDLDLLFVFDAPIEESAKYTRQVQHMLRLLSTSDASGRGYAIDMRLRPSGTQGPLLPSLSQIHAYYTGESGGDRAALWQVQALLRTRALCGNEHVIAACLTRFEQARLACVGADDSATRALRETRLEDACIRHSKTSKLAGALDLKHGRGGLADLEHGVQRLQLRLGLTGDSYAAAVRSLHASAVLSEAEASRVLQAYEFLRLVEQTLHLVTGRDDSLLVRGSASLRRVCDWLMRKGATTARTEEAFWPRLEECLSVAEPTLWGS